MPRFSGPRAVNFAGWVLRNLGAAPGGCRTSTPPRWRFDAVHASPETTIAALEDLAEQCLDARRPGWRAGRLAGPPAMMQAT